MTRTSTKSNTDKQDTKQKCTCCGEPKDIKKDYYVTSSPFHKQTGRLHVCKDCVLEYIGEDVNKLKDALRMIDKAFLVELYKSSIKEAEENEYSITGKYMKNIQMPQYKNYTWNDSDFEGFNKINTVEIVSNVESDVDSEIITYWGKGYQNSEYDFLEDERFNLMSSFECPDYGMEMIMKDICFINLDIEKLRQEKKPSNQKAITALIDTRSKLMNSANMNPIQATGAEASDQLTFGTLIKKWENERPVPKPVDDEMKRYIDTFMIGHLAKMEGLHNEMTEKYDKELSKYTIEFDDIYKDNEEFEE